MARPYASLASSVLIAKRQELAEQLLSIGGRVTNQGNEAGNTSIQTESRIQTTINDINEELNRRGELDLPDSVLSSGFSQVGFN